LSVDTGEGRRHAPVSLAIFFVFRAVITDRHSSVVQDLRRASPSFSAAAIWSGVATCDGGRH